MTILENIPFLESLHPEDIQHLSYFCQEKVMKEWEELFHQWDEPNAFYIVTEGSFSVYKEVNGITQELWPICEWDILWEMALFWESELRNATVVAKQGAKCITILDFSIKELTKKNPKLLEKIQQIIQQRNSD